MNYRERTPDKRVKSNNNVFYPIILIIFFSALNIIITYYFLTFYFHLARFYYFGILYLILIIILLVIFTIFRNDIKYNIFLKISYVVNIIFDLSFFLLYIIPICKYIHWVVGSSGE